MPILEITIKYLLSTWKGTRVLVPGRQNSGASTFFWCFLGCVFSFMLAVFCATIKCLEHIHTLGKKTNWYSWSPFSRLEKTCCQHERAPDFWCPGTKTLVPPTLFGVFSHQCMLISCWQCSNMTRFCVKHINTIGKQEKFKVLKPILEIKTKNCWSAWKGTRLLVPGHQNSGALPSWLTGFLF